VKTARPSLEGVSWSSEFMYPIWVGRTADPTTRLGCKESLDQDTWSWSVESPDTGLDGKSGQFTCVPSTNRGGIQPMPGYPRHFQYQNGDPYWLFGDTHRSVFGSDPEFNWDRTAFKRYVDVRASQGFNFVHGIITSPRDGNEGGEVFSKLVREALNPAFFQEVDSRVAYRII
jgi:hypothetical protein